MVQFEIGGACVVESSSLVSLRLAGCLVPVDVVVISNLGDFTLQWIAGLSLPKSGLQYVELRNVALLTELFSVLDIIEYY